MIKAKYTAIPVAEYIIKRSNELNIPISNLRLQKLLYFCQAAFLATEGIACVGDRCEAWDFGPVFPSVYQRYRVYGSARIPEMTETDPTIISEIDKGRIEAVIKSFREVPTWKMVAITHAQPPWKDNYKSNENVEITPESIAIFFNRVKKNVW